MSRFLLASVRWVSAVEPFFCRLRRGGEEGFLKIKIMEIKHVLFPRFVWPFLFNFISIILRMKIKYLPFTRIKAHLFVFISSGSHFVTSTNIIQDEEGFMKRKMMKIKYVRFPEI